jgi:hypothetical protein
MIAARPAALSLRFGLCAGAGAVFFVTTDFAFAAFARRAFTRFATSFARAAADNFLLAFRASAGAGGGGSDSPRSLAYLAFCARDILRRATALNFLRFPVGASGSASPLILAHRFFWAIDSL